MTAEPLDPVRAETLRQARAEADVAVDRARNEAADLISRAEQEAAALVEKARTQGERDAHDSVRAQAAQARKQARAIVLRARRTVHDTWRDAVVEGIRDLSRSADHSTVDARLAAQARDLLGPDARLDADVSGGYLAFAPGRTVDLSLSAVAERAADDAEAEAGGLWTP